MLLSASIVLLLGLTACKKEVPLSKVVGGWKKEKAFYTNLADSTVTEDLQKIEYHFMEDGMGFFVFPMEENRPYNWYLSEDELHISILVASGVSSSYTIESVNDQQLVLTELVTPVSLNGVLLHRIEFSKTH